MAYNLSQFSNSNGITFGTASNTGGNVITASVAKQNTWSNYFHPGDGIYISLMTSPAQGTHSVKYFPMQNYLTATRVEIPMSISLATSATTNTAALVVSQYFGIYSRNGSTLQSMSTASTQTTWTWASNTASFSSITGARFFSIPINVNMTPGEYFLAYGLSTNSSSVGASTTNLGVSLSIMGGFTGNTVAAAYADIGANTATSNNWWNGHGVYSAQSNGTFTEIRLSGIKATGIDITKANFMNIFRA